MFITAKKHVPRSQTNEVQILAPLFSSHRILVNALSCLVPMFSGGTVGLITALPLRGLWWGELAGVSRQCLVHGVLAAGVNDPADGLPFRELTCPCKGMKTISCQLIYPFFVSTNRTRVNCLVMSI